MKYQLFVQREGESGLEIYEVSGTSAKRAKAHTELKHGGKVTEIRYRTINGIWKKIEV